MGNNYHPGYEGATLRPVCEYNQPVSRHRRLASALNSELAAWNQYNGMWLGFRQSGNRRKRSSHDELEAIVVMKYVFGQYSEFVTVGYFPLCRG
jgi:hypothetical protein